MQAPVHWGTAWPDRFLHHYQRVFVWRLVEVLTAGYLQICCMEDGSLRSAFNLIYLVLASLGELECTRI